MTYMQPGYYPVQVNSTRFGHKYSLYEYREGTAYKGVQSIDLLFTPFVRGCLLFSLAQFYRPQFPAEPVPRKSNPVLFIPGSTGNYKQVRSLAAETSRAASKVRLPSFCFVASFAFTRTHTHQNKNLPFSLSISPPICVACAVQHSHRSS